MAEKVQKSAEEWRKELSAEEFSVLREKGTEAAGSSEYDKFTPKPGEGHFVCRGCKNPLYSAAAKFQSGCGWPAFDMCYEGAVKTNVDNSFGMRRIEILCNRCDGHLGHGTRCTHSRLLCISCSLAVLLQCSRARDSARKVSHAATSGTA